MGSSLASARLRFWSCGASSKTSNKLTRVFAGARQAAAGLLLGLCACRASAPVPAGPTAAVQSSLAATSAPPAFVSPSLCAPTLDDGVSPSYRPDAPIRSAVGRGHILTGVVRSSRGCLPIAGARLELWPEEGQRDHPDASRATLFTDRDGRYRFECDPPEHIHMRISAPGYRTIGVNSYHPDGQTTGSLDLVLAPQP